MLKLRSVLLVLIVAFIFLGCEKFMPVKPKAAAPKPPIGAVVVAKVGNFYITRDDLDKEVKNYNDLMEQQGLPQNKIDTRDEKTEYLKNEMVRRYILYQEALDRGLDRRTEVAHALEQTKISLLVAELLREEIEKIDVSSKEVEDFYNQNKDALREPEQRRIFEILTRTEDDAKQAYIELLKGGDFAALAKQQSRAPSAAKGGDLGYITIDPDPAKRIRPDTFYEVAFSPTLEAGNFSSIFKLPDGYCIVKVDSIKKAEAKPLSELWDRIKAYLLFEKQQKAIAELAGKLRGETKIEIYEGKVD